MRGRTTGPASVQPQPRAACTSDSAAAQACPRPRTGSGGMISAAPPGAVAPAFRRTTGPASVQPQPRAACTSDSTAARAYPRPRTGSGGMISAVFAQAKGMAAWQPAGLRFPVHPPKAQGRPGRLARGRATVCSLRLWHPRKDSPEENSPWWIRHGPLAHCPARCTGGCLMHQGASLALGFPGVSVFSIPMDGESVFVVRRRILRRAPAGFHCFSANPTSWN